MCRNVPRQMQLFDILVDYTMCTHCINVFKNINGNVLRIEHTITHRVRWTLGQAVCGRGEIVFSGRLATSLAFSSYNGYSVTIWAMIIIPSPHYMSNNVL